MQLIQAIPLIWKQKLNDGEKNVEKGMSYKTIT